MKIVVFAYQEYGKPIDVPRKYEFCCWQTLEDWLHSVNVLHRCKECQRKCEDNFKKNLGTRK